ncbi:Protein of unknown function [Arthrobacter alpinus]|uniref:DUF3494 domain-containing protein n=1 Tax=Arthrobacter alpinus TaxID=656366 RepID=A0A1H5NMS3_9MICC|nr:ice-binding family protein [Arthrobacter alpinus]SEF02734.1 Protein of unknown function [Arthrobacter alpinus]
MIQATRPPGGMKGAVQWSPHPGRKSGYRHIARWGSKTIAKSVQISRIGGPSSIRWSAAAGIAALTSVLFVAGMLLSPPRADAAVSPVGLGAAGTYLVLGGTGVTNTGATVLSGDLGVSPATVIVGFPPGIAAGATHAGDAQAGLAQTDLLSAYNNAAGRIPTALDFAGDQNGKTFTPGVYHTAAAFTLTGVMTLDGQGDPNAVFIFQVGAALNTAAGSSVSLVNGAQASNVFWQVLGAAGTGASSSFSGTIMALGAITVGAGAVVTGRALSHAGLVTLSTNTFTFPGGALSISAPTAKNFGSGAAGGKLTVQLGGVTATDNRGQSGAGWTVQASSTAFSNTTTPAAAPIMTTTYASGAATSTTGIAVFLPGQTTTMSTLSSFAVTAFSASATGGSNSATWNPTIVVNLPAQAITGSYTGTITHSVY